MKQSLGLSHLDMTMAREISKIEKDNNETFLRAINREIAKFERILQKTDLPNEHRASFEAHLKELNKTREGARQKLPGSDSE